MAYALIIKPQARKSLDKIPENYRARITSALDSLTIDPYQGKGLTGKKKGQYSIAVWPYRIIYTIFKKELVIIVIDVGHRQGVYK